MAKHPVFTDQELAILWEHYDRGRGFQYEMIQLANGERITVCVDCHFQVRDFNADDHAKSCPQMLRYAITDKLMAWHEKDERENR